MAIDFGFARIGIATGDADVGLATARPPLAASGKLAQDAKKIGELAALEHADRIALGLPVEESGELGKMAKICGRLADELRSLGWDVDMIDERFSSQEAEATLRESDLKASQRRKLRDGEAARILLERYFETLEKT